MIVVKRIGAFVSIGLTVIVTYLTLFYASAAEFVVTFGGLLMGWVIALFAVKIPMVFRLLAPALFVAVTYAARLIAGGDPGFSIEEAGSVGLVFAVVLVVSAIAMALLRRTTVRVDP